MSLNALAAAMAPPRGRIVDDGREEVDRHHEGAIIGNPIDRGVVFGGGVVQDVGIGDPGDVAQHLRQLGGPEFTGSASAVR